VDHGRPQADQVAENVTYELRMLATASPRVMELAARRRPDRTEAARRLELA
jgi:hypothetical protein